MVRVRYGIDRIWVRRRCRLRCVDALACSNGISFAVWYGFGTEWYGRYWYGNGNGIGTGTVLVRVRYGIDTTWVR